MKTNLPKTNGYFAPTVHKAFAVLDEIARSPVGLGISELARRLAMSKSTIHGITLALLDIGALHQEAENKKFHLGPALVRLGSQAATRLDLRAVAQPILDNLSQLLRETVFLGTLEENGIVIILKADSPAELKISSPVGTRIPVLSGATGKVLLASLEEVKLRKILQDNRLPVFTENSITDVEEYLRIIEEVRQTGFATDYDEYINGVNAVSVPVGNPSGPPAALWIVGFSSTFNHGKIGRAITELKKAAQRINSLTGVEISQ